MGTPWEQVRAKYGFDEAELDAIRRRMLADLTPAERALIERARAGDARGLWRRDVNGRWELL